MRRYFISLRSVLNMCHWHMAPYPLLACIKNYWEYQLDKEKGNKVIYYCMPERKRRIPPTEGIVCGMEISVKESRGKP